MFLLRSANKLSLITMLFQKVFEGQNAKPTDNLFFVTYNSSHPPPKVTKWSRRSSVWLVQPSMQQPVTWWQHHEEHPINWLCLLRSFHNLTKICWTVEWNWLGRPKYDVPLLWFSLELTHAHSLYWNPDYLVMWLETVQTLDNSKTFFNETCSSWKIEMVD